jgi:CheY-like chemotaxis protein
LAKTILCADDSVTMQKVAEITFGGSEYRYVGARNADEALKLARSEKPAIVLADAVMPGKTGYDLCHAIKSDPALAGIPVILLCGNTNPFDASRGADVGADGHLPKPWDTQAMLDKVGELLGKGPSSARPAAAGGPTSPRPATPAPVAQPTVRPGPAAAVAAAAMVVPQPPRSATIMGMPAFPMPAGMLGGVAPVAPAPIAAAKSTGTPPPGAAAPAGRSAPANQDRPSMDRPSMDRPSMDRPSMDRPPMDRPSMIKAGRPDTNQRIMDVLGRMPRVADVAKEAGLDPRGPEMQALLKLSFEVVERVVWEIVPELAEELIRDNLEKRAR